MAFDSDGQMEKMQVNGNVFLQVTDPDFASVRVHVKHGAGGDFQFKTHPKLHKESFLGNADPWLQLAKGAFPVGNPLGVLKWRYTSNDEDKALVKVSGVQHACCLYKSSFCC